MYLEMKQVYEGKGRGDMGGIVLCQISVRSERDTGTFTDHS